MEMPVEDIIWPSQKKWDIESVMELTIITINYNNRDGLKRTIDSVMSQTYKEFEWILVDGGSTDGGKDLILQYQDCFSYWCSEPDKGIYNAMNKGVDKANGEYLLFLNSGDVLFDNDVLERALSQPFDADIISGQMVRMDNYQPLRHYNSDIVYQLFNDTLSHQATFIRREVFDSIRYDESLKIVSDWKFWWDSIVFHQCSFKELDLCISKQDMTGISLSEKYKEMHQAERKQVLETYFPPLVIKSFENYLSLQHRAEIKNLNYLKDKHGHLYELLKRVIYITTVLCQKFHKN